MNRECSSHFLCDLRKTNQPTCGLAAGSLDYKGYSTLESPLGVILRHTLDSPLKL